MDAFETFPVLKTKRLVLREITRTDLPELVYITSFQNGEISEEKTLEILDKLEEDYKQKRAINWGLEWEGKLIGTCGYYRGFANQTGEVGYVMRDKYRGRGFMSEALEKVVSFGFDQLDLKHITAFTADDNLASLRILKKQNFEPTNEIDKGSYRKHILSHGI